MKKPIYVFSISVIIISCQLPVENKKTGISKSDSIISPKVYGIEISSYQGDGVEYLERNKDSLGFVICKATEGITVIDPDFTRNWKLISEKGFVRGAYHFYHCQDDPSNQAEHFISTVDSWSHHDLPPIVDFEEASLDLITDTTRIRNDLLAFLGLLERRTGITPMIYVDYHMGNTYLNDPSFAKYPLYIADYEGLSEPNIPNAWRSRKWQLWQKNDNIEINGNTNDLDEFNGNIDSLISFIKPN